ncbi:NfeD family protein [Thalassospira lucentensis]|uniref:NfeD family protein n=1 Tax=Thalassospira lucentensis TaxID=168935 RepID=UPI003AA98AF1
MELFSQLVLEFWHWWILACLMLVLEMVLPGIIFLWLSVAAAVVGFVVLLVPDLAIELQLIAFGVFSVLSFVIGRRFFRPNLSGASDEDVSSTRSSLVGKTTVLTEKTTNGRVRQSVYGSSWVLKSNHDLAKGQKVRVSGIEGSMLLIEPVTADTES